MSALVHGGDLEAFGRRHPDAPRPLVDLSTGINPFAYEAEVDNSWMTRLPGQSDEDACRGAFAAYASIDTNVVHVFPGTQSIISGLPFLFDAKRVVVLSPTYGEHEASWTVAGHDVAKCAFADILDTDADIILVTNPNNPDGHVFEPAELAACQARQKARGGWLIVDEAFIDCAPQASVAKEVQKGGLLVLRSFGKFFGLAGLRLGFLVGPGEIATRLGQRLGPWNVSTPALGIGAKAYSDVDWIAATRQALAQNMARLRSLVAPGLGVALGSTSLFLLLDALNVSAISTHLAAHGIFVRTFPNMPNYLRIGLPGEPWAWDRLETALTEWENLHERE